MGLCLEGAGKLTVVERRVEKLQTSGEVANKSLDLYSWVPSPPQADHASVYRLSSLFLGL